MGDWLNIDQHILKYNKVRCKTVAIAWSDYKKVMFDVVSPTWKIECLEMYKISDRVIDFITEAMKKRVETLEKIQRCIF